MTTLIDTKIGTTTINSELKRKQLWQAGCQFLSFKEKMRLLTGSPRVQKEVYKILKAKNDKIAQALRDADRKHNYVFTEDGSAKGVQIAGDIKDLEKFMFKVDEDAVYFSNGKDMIPAPKNKAIVTESGNIISVVKNSYRLVKNEEVILPLLEGLDKLDNKWIVDPSHSFISDDKSKMRVQITFPELTFQDGDSDIAMSLYINNSYDYSSAVNGMWGAIRGICSNGMVFGKIFQKFSIKHTSGFNMDFIKHQIEETYKSIPTIQQRVELLSAKTFKMTEKLEEEIKDNLGRRAFAYYNQENEQEKIKNMWALYNVFTYYISHYVNYKQREAYQSRLSKMFEF